MSKPKLTNSNSESNVIAVPAVPKTETTSSSVQDHVPNLCLKNASFYFSQYCGSTSIHGIKYIGQRGRYFIEKLIWIIIVAMVFTICVMLIRKTYIKWKTTPVIVTFATTEMAISQIPFPAVTICPEAKFDPEVFNFTNTFIRNYLNANLTNKEKDYLQLSALICDGLRQNSEMVHTNRTVEPEIIDQIIDFFPEFDPLNVTTVKWLDQKLTDVLSLKLTSEGVCYTFNTLSNEEIFKIEEPFNKPSKPGEKARKWSLEDGYPSGDNLDSFPRRTFMSGFEGGFTLDALYTNDSHLDFLCDESLQGYKVVLHHPSELPNMEKHFRLPLDQAVLVSVKPTMITVSDEVLSYDPHKRQCYFARERNLAMYNLYTQENCLVECMANYTLSKCGCLPFYVPRYEGTKICGPGSNVCLMNSRINYLKSGSNTDLGGQQCGCLPSCTSLTYNVETSQTEWDWQKMFQVFRIIYPHSSLLPSKQNAHFSRLVVYYKDLQFLTSERTELYGFVDFFSNMGGLLGLCIGISVTSMIEILYFLTLRLICNVKKYGKNTWSGEPELINAQSK